MTKTTTVTTLVAGVGDGETTACLMSYRALLDGRGLTDGHPSASVGALGIALNDSSLWLDDGHRTAVLVPIALDKRLCASRVVVTPRLEAARAYRCTRWAQQWTDDERVDECLGVVEAWLAGDETADLVAAEAGAEAAMAAARAAAGAAAVAAEAAEAAAWEEAEAEAESAWAAEAAASALSWLVTAAERAAAAGEAAETAAAEAVVSAEAAVRADPSRRDRVIDEACELLLALCEMDSV